MDFALSWIDLLLGAILLVSALVGLLRGLVFELLSLAGWVVAYLGAPSLAPMLYDWLPAERLGPALLHALGLALGFVLILLVWGLAARLVKSLVRASPLSVLDRLAGAGFGALRGVLIGLLMVVVAGFTPLARSATWQASQMAPRLAGLMHDLRPLLPDTLARVMPAPADPTSSDSDID
jgi:membrane protein required for colicin V production